jgi:hypothetical protein
MQRQRRRRSELACGCGPTDSLLSGNPKALFNVVVKRLLVERCGQAQPKPRFQRLLALRGHGGG